jgi:glyoxylase-like metal-dependent hydrolase (beta-lactamase superfamily II)
VTLPPGYPDRVPTPEAPRPYRYWLTLESLDASSATFRAAPPPAPADDTRLHLSRGSWVDLGGPTAVTVTIEPGHTLQP